MLLCDQINVLESKTWKQESIPLSNSACENYPTPPMYLFPNRAVILQYGQVPLHLCLVSFGFLALCFCPTLGFLPRLSMAFHVFRAKGMKNKHLLVKLYVHPLIKSDTYELNFFKKKEKKRWILQITFFFRASNWLVLGCLTFS